MPLTGGRTGDDEGEALRGFLNTSFASDCLFDWLPILDFEDVLFFIAMLPLLPPVVDVVDIGTFAVFKRGVEDDAADDAVSPLKAEEGKLSEGGGIGEC